MKFFGTFIIWVFFEKAMCLFIATPWYFIKTIMHVSSLPTYYVSVQLLVLRAAPPSREVLHLVFLFLPFSRVTALRKRVPPHCCGNCSLDGTVFTSSVFRDDGWFFRTSSFSSCFLDRSCLDLNYFSTYIVDRFFIAHFNPS